MRVRQPVFFDGAPGGPRFFSQSLRSLKIRKLNKIYTPIFTLSLTESIIKETAAVLFDTVMIVTAMRGIASVDKHFKTGKQKGDRYGKYVYAFSRRKNEGVDVKL